MAAHRFRHAIIGLAILLATGFALLNLLARSHARAMMEYSAGGARTNKPESLSWPARIRVLLLGVEVPRPVSRRPPTDLAPGCEEVKIPSTDGVSLSAWHVDQGPESPLVILFHGYAAEKTSLLPEAQALLELGASVLLVDFRGSGGSSASYATMGVREADDVAAAATYARAHFRYRSLVLFGQSMGGVAILRAIPLHRLAPDAVIVEAVFDSMLNTVRNRFHAMGVPSFPSAELLVFWGGRRGGFSGFAHEPVQYARALECPSLFMHGEDDPRATLAEGRRVFAAVPGPKTFRSFPSVGHESYAARYPAKWRAAVMDLLQKIESAPGVEEPSAGGEAPLFPANPLGIRARDRHSRSRMTAHRGTVPGSGCSPKGA